LLRPINNKQTHKTKQQTLEQTHGDQTFYDLKIKRDRYAIPQTLSSEIKGAYCLFMVVNH